MIGNLNVNKSKGKRRPHKPLLMLIAIANVLNGRHQLSFAEVKELLTPLLNAYAPPVKGRHQPELPYWHLQSDEIWQVDGADTLPMQKGGFPQLRPLGETAGHLDSQLIDLLKSDGRFAEQLVDDLLNDFFPPSAHEQILAQVGLELIGGAEQDKRRRPRDPAFRQKVLRAYEHKCAVTGFRAALGGTYFGVEAGHIRWHAYDGA